MAGPNLCPFLFLDVIQHNTFHIVRAIFRHLDKGYVALLSEQFVSGKASSNKVRNIQRAETDRVMHSIFESKDRMSRRNKPDFCGQEL